MSINHATSLLTQSTVSDTRLYGRWLMLARLGAITVALLTVAAFLALLPAYMSYLHTVCAGAVCPVGQLTPPAVQALQQVGLSVDAFVGYTLALTLFSLLMCLSVAAVIFWRKSDDWMALLVALMLVLMGTTYVTHMLVQRPSPWQIPALLLGTLALGALLLVFSLFPSGRFVPPWIVWLPISWIAWGLVVIFLHDLPWFYQIYLLGLVVELIGIVAAQIYRNRRVSTAIQRQQSKWVVLGASTAMVAVVVVLLPEALLPSLVQLSWAYRLLDAPALTLALFLGALSFGMAILRSHLWEIDRIINRTLVYSTLTVTLALIYVGLVIALQFLFRQLMRLNSDLAVVASTLVIAALFQPLRRRIQMIIDRRFYRHKYDAAKTVAAFSVTMRNEVDLTQLSGHLLNVVQETMQPAHVSLWLRPPEHDGTERDPWRATPPGSSEGG